MNEDLVFCTNPMSRGRIVRWLLEEKPARLRAREIDDRIMSERQQHRRSPA